MFVVVAAVALIVVLCGFYLSWRVTRLDRLHGRVDTSRAALEAALARRGMAVIALADAKGCDPAASRALVDAVEATHRAGEDERELAESALSGLLRKTLEDEERPFLAKTLLAEVADAAKEVHMARTFHNDAVAHTRRARRSPLVRTLRLAGRAPLPGFFEIDDEPPRLLSVPVDTDPR